MNTPRVSILMPVYNGMPLIKASIESILQQTCSDWECIIVNDGSNDGTKEYLDTLEDSRFVIWHFEKNKGRSKARQKALELVRGDFIAMLDAEDLYHSSKLELQLAEFDQHPEIDLVATQMCSFGTHTDLLTIRGDNDKSIQIFTGENVPGHATVMIRTSIAKKTTYNLSLNYGEDVDFLKKYMKDSLFMTIPQALYYYSEYNSVSKKKIRLSYWQVMRKYFNDRNYKNSFINFLKLIYSLVVYPFYDIKTILKKRGRELTELEKKEFNVHCRSIIDKVIVD